MTKINYNFISNIRKTLPVNISSIIYTNYHLRKSLTHWYILRLDRDKLEYLQILKEGYNNMLYYFQSDKIYINGKLNTNEFNDELKKTIRSVLIDTKNKKCNIYEEQY